MISLAILYRNSEKEHVINEYLVSFIFHGTESEINLTYSIDQENITYDVRAPRDPTGHRANITQHTLIEGEHKVKITIENTNIPRSIQFNLKSNDSSLIVSINSQYEISSRFYDYFAWGD